MATQVHTVIIDTEHLDELAEFYREGLDLGPPRAELDHLGFELQGTYFGIDRVASRPGRERGSVSIWFEVDDLEVAFDRLIALGATSCYPPVEKPWGAWLAAVFDPDGNLVGLTGPAPERPP